MIGHQQGVGPVEFIRFAHHAGGSGQCAAARPTSAGGQHPPLPAVAREQYAGEEHPTADGQSGAPCATDGQEQQFWIHRNSLAHKTPRQNGRRHFTRDVVRGNMPFEKGCDRSTERTFVYKNAAQRGNQAATAPCEVLHITRVHPCQRQSSSRSAVLKSGSHAGSPQT